MLTATSCSAQIQHRSIADVQLQSILISCAASVAHKNYIRTYYIRTYYPSLNLAIYQTSTILRGVLGILICVVQPQEEQTFQEQKGVLETDNHLSELMMLEEGMMFRDKREELPT